MNLFFPVLSEEQRTAYLALQEAASAHMKAKWDWYVDQLVSSAKFMPADIPRKLAATEEYHKWMK